MIPEISEFTYGFALTNELVGWIALAVAPVFPSLIEEGKRGGGYDLKLDQPGAPLYLQFKRSDYMTRSSAAEIKNYNLPLSMPFYRFPITQRNKSFQHTSLVELDDGNNLVFYTAPRFHLISEINEAWRAQDISARSIFVAPSAIGLIHDNDRHHVSYDANQTYFCSEPKEINGLSATDLRNRIEAHLSSDSRPVGKQLPFWLANIRERRTSARRTQSVIEAEIEVQKKTSRVPSGAAQYAMPGLKARVAVEDSASFPIAPPSPEIRAPRELSEQELTLRKISDEALHGFGAQLFVIQPR